MRSELTILIYRLISVANVTKINRRCIKLTEVDRGSLLSHEIDQSFHVQFTSTVYADKPKLESIAWLFIQLNLQIDN